MKRHLESQKTACEQGASSLRLRKGPRKKGRTADRKGETSATKTVGLWCDRWMNVAAPTIAAAIGFLVFVNGLWGEFVYDDLGAVQTNMDLRPETPWSELWKHDFWGNPINTPGVWSHKSFRPFTVLTFRLNYLAHGLNTFGYHLLNVICHSLVCYLLYYVALVVLHGNRAASFLAALLFAVHPIHTDAIDSVVGRAEALCGIFSLLCFLAYVKAASFSSSPTQASQSWFWLRKAVFLTASTFSLLLATYSKEIGITVAGVCLAWDVLQQNFQFRRSSKSKPGSSSSWKHFVFRCFFMGFVACGYILHRRMHVGSIADIRMRKLHNPIAFITEEASSMPSATPAGGSLAMWLSIFHLHARYILLLFFPFHLSADYSFDCIPALIPSLDPRQEPRVLLILALWAVVAAFLAATVFWVVERRCREAYWMSFLWFALPFLPASQLFFFPATVLAERVLYLPSVGFCLGLSYLLSNLLSSSTPTFLSPSTPVAKVQAQTTEVERPKNQRLRFLLFWAVVLVILLCFSVRTWTRNLDWQSNGTLFASAMAVCPDSAKVRYNHAISLEQVGKHDEALKHYEVALAIDSDYADAAGRLGKYYYLRSQPQKALEYYEVITERKPTKQWHAHAWHDAGVVLWKLGRQEEAEKMLRFAMKLPRQHHQYETVAEMNLACLYLHQGKAKEALEVLDTVTSSPTAYYAAWAWNLKGVALAKAASSENNTTTKWEAAKTAFQKAIQLSSPSSPSSKDKTVSNYQRNLAEAEKGCKDSGHPASKLIFGFLHVS
ncbi:Protein O-mannosyl-transferase tmtc3 [Balamuthia mandrillaris]